MPELDLIDEDANNTVFRDVIFLALAGFVAMVLLILPHLNPPETAKAGAPAPGNVIVEISWPREIDADVDLWVEAPGDMPVGYSNKGGQIFNLLRDDLGREGDVTEINHEISYSRGIPSGEYVVNLHLYRDLSGQLPIPVNVAVSVKSDPADTASGILASTVNLGHQGEELTVFRFALDDSGSLVAGSVHDLPKSLRGRKNGG